MFHVWAVEKVLFIKERGHFLRGCLFLRSKKKKTKKSHPKNVGHLKFSGAVFYFLK